MSKLKKAWVWCKSKWQWIVAALSFIFMLVIVFFSRSQGLGTKIAFKKLDLSRELREVARIKGQKEILQLNKEANAEEIKKLEDTISSINIEIEHKKAEITKMSLKRKLDMYDDLGY